MAPLRYAAKLDPFLSLDRSPCPPTRRHPRKGRDLILPSGNLASDPGFATRHGRQAVSVPSEALGLASRGRGMVAPRESRPYIEVREPNNR